MEGGTPQKPEVGRFCTVRSFSGSHVQGPCEFPGFPASDHRHKSPKLVGSCAFPGFPASGTAEMEGTPKAQNLSILQSPLLFRKPCPSPLWISWISGLWNAEMEGTLHERKICRFCRVRSFSGSHFQGRCGFPAAGGRRRPVCPDFVRETAARTQN